MVCVSFNNFNFIRDRGKSKIGCTLVNTHIQNNLGFVFYLNLIADAFALKMATLPCNIFGVIKSPTLSDIRRSLHQKKMCAITGRFITSSWLLRIIYAIHPHFAAFPMTVKFIYVKCFIHFRHDCSTPPPPSPLTAE